MSQFSENFEGGTNTASITTLNTIFDGGTFGGTTPIFSNTFVFNGIMASRFQANVSSVGVAQLNNLTSASTYYVRLFFYVDTTSGIPNNSMIARLGTGTTNQMNAIYFLSTGKLSLQTTAGSAQATTTNTYKDGWYRAEWDVTGTTQTLRTYSGGGTTLIESISGTANNTAVNQFCLGNGNQTVGGSSFVWFDELALDPTTQPGWGSTLISGSDTGTGVDARSALTVTLSAADTGTGVEGGNVVVTAKSDNDSGTGVDARAALVATGLTDTDLAQFIDSATTSSRQMSDGDSGSGRESSGLAQVVKSTWRFTPPSNADYFQVVEHSTFFITMNQGLSVLKTAGAYVTLSTPLPEDIAAADIVYLGGRSYAVDDTERAALTTAGYGAYVALVPDPS